jgi:hypothetical protein
MGCNQHLGEKHMNAQILNDTRPSLAAGQLWQHRGGGDVYLVTRNLDKFTLINTNNFSARWATNDGFAEQEEKFTYVGMLKITKD